MVQRILLLSSLNPRLHVSPLRAIRPLVDYITRDWPAIRKDFESCALSFRKFAESRNIPLGTLRHHIRDEGWTQGRKLVKASVATLERKIENRVKLRLENELAPFIEKEKDKFTRTGIRIAKRGLKRTEQFFRMVPDPEPKMDAFIAKAATDWHRMGRTALGMSDGTTVTPLTLNVLANHSAIQVVSDTDSQE